MNIEQTKKRFLSRLKRREGGCLEHPGVRIMVGGKLKQVDHVAWYFHTGHWPTQIVGMCRSWRMKPCCNPAHIVDSRVIVSHLPLLAVQSACERLGGEHGAQLAWLAGQCPQSRHYSSQQDPPWWIAIPRRAFIRECEMFATRRPTEQIYLLGWSVWMEATRQTLANTPGVPVTKAGWRAVRGYLQPATKQNEAE